MHGDRLDPQTMSIEQLVRLPDVSRRQQSTGLGQGETPQIPPGTAVIKHAEKLAGQAL
ncbi:hypothetical protein GCM10012282_75710 [Streptomyces lacrimifluminis]|uniref:Uncharacterized protein n=1 Tax=Streptomyces lacrimifluminis TaxID=1500077 RepID=A0A917UM42_9ACTN|nr:hypothetical protein GCM10012282_75710 [Streptomyces lacrimifluminis]